MSKRITQTNEIKSGNDSGILFSGNEKASYSEDFVAADFTGNELITYNATVELISDNIPDAPALADGIITPGEITIDGASLATFVVQFSYRLNGVVYDPTQATLQLQLPTPTGTRIDIIYGTPASTYGVIEGEPGDPDNGGTYNSPLVPDGNIPLIKLIRYPGGANIIQVIPNAGYMQQTNPIAFADMFIKYGSNIYRDPVLGTDDSGDDVYRGYVDGILVERMRIYRQVGSSTEYRIRLEGDANQDYEILHTGNIADNVAPVAISGDYSDLINKPDIPSEAPVQSVNGRIGTVVGLAEYSDLQDEISRATGVEDVLQTNLVNEVGNRIIADENLQEQINKSQIKISETIIATEGQTEFIFTELIGQFVKLCIRGKSNLYTNDVDNTPSDELGTVEFDVTTGTITTPDGLSAGETLKVEYTATGNGDVVPDSVVLESELAPLKDKVDKVIVTSKNYADKSLIIPNEYYANGSGNLTTDDPRFRRLSLIFLESGEWTISGCHAQLLGNIYSNNNPIGANRIGTVNVATSDYVSKATFTVPDSVDGGSWVGINVEQVPTGATTSGAYDKTVMLAKGTNEVYEPFGYYVKSDSIYGDFPGYTKDTVFTPVKTKVDETIEASLNLIMPDAILSGNGKAWGNAIPTITTSASGECVGALIPCLPNSDMFIQGIHVQHIGNIMASDGVTRLRKIVEPGAPVYTSYGFNTGADAAFLQINISNEHNINPNAYDDTAMLSYSTGPKPYQRGGVYTIDWDKISGFPGFPTTDTNSDCFYSFNLASNQFNIYCKFPGSEIKYFGFYVRRTVDSSIRLDSWRLYGGNIFQYSSESNSMTIQSKNVLSSNLESEWVYRQSGKIDYSGGYHGDEVLSQIDFFVNGSKISMPVANVALTACNIFQYRQKSSMYEAAPTGYPSPILPTAIKQNDHIKISSFSKGAFKTKNTATWAATLDIGGIDISEGFAGLFCLGKAMAKNVYSRRSMDVYTMTGGNDTFFNEKFGSNAWFGYNDTEGLSGVCSAKINTIIENLVDKTVEYTNSANLEAWDRINDTKFYLRFFNKKAYPNDIWDVEMTFNFES